MWYHLMLINTLQYTTCADMRGRKTLYEHVQLILHVQAFMFSSSGGTWLLTRQQGLLVRNKTLSLSDTCANCTSGAGKVQIWYQTMVPIYALEQMCTTRAVLRIGIRCRPEQMQKLLFIQARFSNQVIRDTKHNTTGRVVKEVRSQKN